MRPLCRIRRACGRYGSSRHGSCNNVCFANQVLLCDFYDTHSEHARKLLTMSSHTCTYAHSDDGGGGERVLWRAIYALSQLSRNKHKRIHIFIYAGGKDMSGDAILDKARDTFGIDLRTGDGDTTVPITFVHLRYRWLLEPSWYVIC